MNYKSNVIMNYKSNVWAIDMVDEDISDSLNDMIAKNKKGKPIIQSAKDTMEQRLNETQPTSDTNQEDIIARDKQGKPIKYIKPKEPIQPAISYEEQEKENIEYTTRLKSAHNIQEYQAIQKERTDKRLARLKKVPSRPAEQRYQKEKEQVQETQQQETVIPSVIKEQPTSSVTPSVDEENRTKFGINYVKPVKRQAGKDYLWIPTANEYAEYIPDKQIEIENALTQKKEVVTMEQLKYLYSPSATGFVKEKKATNYTSEIKPFDKDGEYILEQKKQMRITTRIRIEGKEYTLEGYSHVSKGNLTVNEARKEAQIRIRAKIIYAVQLMRDGYSEDDAFRIAEESPVIDEVTTTTPLPQDVEIEETSEEEQLNWVT